MDLEDILSTLDPKDARLDVIVAYNHGNRRRDSAEWRLSEGKLYLQTKFRLHRDRRPRDIELQPDENELSSLESLIEVDKGFSSTTVILAPPDYVIDSIGGDAEILALDEKAVWLRDHRSDIHNTEIVFKPDLESGNDDLIDYEVVLWGKGFGQTPKQISCGFPILTYFEKALEHPAMGNAELHFQADRRWGYHDYVSNKTVQAPGKLNSLALEALSSKRGVAFLMRAGDGLQLQVVTPGDSTWVAEYGKTTLVVGSQAIDEWVALLNRGKVVSLYRVQTSAYGLRVELSSIPEMISQMKIEAVQGSMNLKIPTGNKAYLSLTSGGAETLKLETSDPFIRSLKLSSGELARLDRFSQALASGTPDKDRVYCLVTDPGGPALPEHEFDNLRDDWVGDKRMGIVIRN